MGCLTGLSHLARQPLLALMALRLARVEIALTFDRLIATASNKTKLGFPEVNLGILPGYGSGQHMGRWVPRS